MRKSLVRWLGLCLLLAVALGAHAQAWPTQPVRFIVPFPPGGTTDQIIRHAQPHLQQSLGTQIVIENRGGASGAIGTGVAAKSAPDGYTFVLVFDTHGVNPSLIPGMTFDTLKDLAPVMLIGKSPMVFTTHPTTPYKTFRDVLAATRANPNSVSYGSIGSGSLAHLFVTLISKQGGFSLTHVPYKGGGPLVTDSVAGHVPVSIATAALLAPHIQSGKLRALAVTSPQRFPQLPEVPTLAEQGVAGLDAEAWWGLLAPAKTPAPIIARMNAEFAKALRVPAVNERLTQQGVVLSLSQPEEFGKFVAGEVERWGKVVRENAITAGQ
ncbi:MAG: receptor [Betaproteobacteria bacterium RIFCSPLOWO2_02_67_12]|nr:MAG: receptor [Betaproteobacteria bacterium RIFCSPLOWO2_02_67_12]